MLRVALWTLLVSVVCLTSRADMTFPYSLQYDNVVDDQIQAIARAFVQMSQALRPIGEIDAQSLEGMDLAQLVSILQVTSPDSSSPSDAIAPYGVGAGVPSLPVHSGLSKSCNNLLCGYVQRALSCKGMSVKMEKICAHYMVGALFQCSDYPSQLYQAPSICINYYISFLGVLLQGQAGNTDAVVNYFTGFLKSPDFETNSCERRCYQYYRQAANDFYLQCFSEVLTYSTVYPLIATFGNSQDFRLQGCNYNSNHTNCYSAFYQMTANPIPLPIPINIFQFDCDYYPGIPAELIQTQIYATFSKNLGGCCMSTAINLAMQNQMSTTKLTLFPPCLLSYFASRGVDFAELCVSASVAPQAIITAKLHVINTATALPVLTVNTSVVSTMGIISYALSYVGFGNQPFNFRKAYPFQVMITGLANTTAVAGFNTIPVQLTMQNLDSTQLAQLQAALVSPQLGGVMSSAQAFGGTAYFTMDTGAEAAFITPANLTFSAAARSSVSTFGVSLVAAATLSWLLLGV